MNKRFFFTLCAPPVHGARALLIVVILGFVALFGAPTPHGAAVEPGMPLVMTVNYPLYYFARRIAGAHAKVRFPAPKGLDPAFWSPSAKDVLGFQNADLILINGADYAKWIDKVSLPPSRMINTSRVFAKDYLPAGVKTTHSHGPQGAHSHTGWAFTTWLDFTQAVKQASTIKDALVRLRPGRAKILQSNFTKLEQELLALDAELIEIANRNKDTPVFASHPVYQYFARRYGLKFVAVTWEPDILPDDGQWRALRRLFAAHRARWMIWEARPNQETVTRLKDLGIKTIVFDPVANVPDRGDFLTKMRANLGNLRRALSSP